MSLKSTFSNLKDKISEAIVLLKNRRSYSYHDFTTAATIEKSSIVSGDRNVDNKREIARHNYLELFDRAFKNKSIEEIIDYITGENLLKNFSNKGEIKKIIGEIDSINKERKHISTNPKQLTIDSIYDGLGAKYLVPVDGELNENTRRAYNLVANRTQAIYRVISFIKTNYQAIINKCDINATPDNANSKENLKKLLDIVQMYAKSYSSYSSYRDFYLTNFQNELLDIGREIDASAYSEDDVLSRGYDIAQIRCTNLARANIASDQGLVVDAQAALDKASKNAKEFTALVTEAQQLKKESLSLQEQIANIEAANKGNQQINDVIRNVYNSTDKSCESEIEKAWIGTGNDTDIAGKAYERQKQMIDALHMVADDILFFKIENEGKDSPTRLTPIKGPDAGFDEKDCELLYKGGTKIEGLQGLQALLRAYQNDTEVENKQEILKVYTFKTQEGEEQDKILTNEQITIMNNLYQKLKAYYAKNGSLKGFAYQSATHSIPEDILENMTAVFKNDFENNTALTDLKSEQIDVLHMFIRNYEPVKGLFSKKEIVQYEIDSRLIGEYISKEESCKNIVDFIKVKTIENNLRIANKHIEGNNELATRLDIQRQANNAGAENDLEEARRIKEETEKLAISQEAISQPTKEFKDEANELVGNLAKEMTLPDSYEELSTSEEINLASAAEIDTVEDKRQNVALGLSTDASTLRENSNREDIIAIYKKYLTSGQVSSLADFIKQVDKQTQELKENEENMFIEK